MNDYTVTWEIQVMAYNPRGAAILAQELQRDLEAKVGVFTVTPFLNMAVDPVTIDLDKEPS